MIIEQEIIYILLILLDYEQIHCLGHLLHKHSSWQPSQPQPRAASL